VSLITVNNIIVVTYSSKCHRLSLSLITKDHYQARWVDGIIKIKPFRLVFACITDSDNQGKVPNGSIIDRDNQESFNLIIKSFHHFSPNLSNSVYDDSPDQTHESVLTEGPPQKTEEHTNVIVGHSRC
jgi:hypothetical protein